MRNSDRKDSRHAAIAQLSRFKSSYTKWKAGEIKNKPMFYKDNSAIRAWLISQNVDPEEHYGHSAKNIELRMEAEREYKRTYYEKEAIRRNGVYNPTGPQRKSDEELMNIGKEGYDSLTDEEKLRKHELHFIKKDVRDGYRCPVCKEWITDEEVHEGFVESRIKNGIEFQLHKACIARMVHNMNKS